MIVLEKIARLERLLAQVQERSAQAPAFSPETVQTKAIDLRRLPHFSSASISPDAASGGSATVVPSELDYAGPSSSPRFVTDGDALGGEADDEPLTHTPPPESGRQVSASPGHVPADVAVAVAAAGMTAPTRVARPELPAASTVGTFEGALPGVGRGTFGELLEATLSL